MKRRSLLKDRRGVAAAEAALVFTFVTVPILLGAVDYGFAFNGWTRMNLALRSALFEAWAGNTTFTSPDSSVTLSTATSCYCITPTGSRLSGTAVACGSTCTTSGQQLAQYITVSARTSVNLPLRLPGLASPLALSTSATVRTK